MITRQGCTVSGLIFVVLAALVASPVRADVARARALFQQAETSFGRGEFSRALDLYQQAYRLKPLPGFHFNIAQCYRNLGDCEQAIHHFEQYLAAGAKPGNREVAEELVASCQRLLAEQPPRTAPVAGEAGAAGADEQPPDLAAGPAQQGSEAPAVAAATSDSEPGPGPRRGLHPALFWGAAGVTAALLLTGTITGAAALSAESEFNDPATSQDELRGIKDRGQALGTASTVLFSLGAAGAVGTAVLYFFTDFGGERSEQSVGAAPAPGGGLLVWNGRF